MELNTIQIAQAAIAEIAKQFPNLTMVKNTEDPVELNVNVPVQSGLKYKIWLGLQNSDELFFAVSDNFYVSFYPCTNRNNVDLFVKAVTGFMSGELGVIEYYRGRYCVKAYLQNMGEQSRCTMATWHGRFWRVFGRKTTQILRNDDLQG
ncbi:hypothetical protein [Marinicella gelatinilytica]|uniref:hypothetical protein n=1 Tax=Marinicella gelatinilytica TaxID=2996017 RepID=UPI0022608C13|nr:hypothetical protein [Marinicella gelatinilytica]MCX7545020.1 hypothetical protein [Marinicella gelatinilytica]